MFAQGGLRIELHRGHKLTVFEVNYDRALIGSGAHCDVRLAPNEAAIEHLVVRLVGDDEVFGETKAIEPVCLLNGAPFLEGRLVATSLLELGGVALRVLRTNREEPAAVRKAGASKSTTSPTVQALGLIGVALGLYVVLSKPGLSDSGVATGIEPPLLAAVAPEPCAEHDVRSAAALATQSESEAESKRERAPFYPGAGSEAIIWYERAAGCYAAAGQPERAAEAHAAAARIQADIADEIHLRHVRLERYLTQGEYPEARRQATVLAELVVEKNGAYARWLSAVRREGELRAHVEAPR
ncbi:MAG: hypothetical protein RL701_541 [Pseudomonadota bacterium]